jgi:serine/threonine protein phosphatase PrpC
MRIGAKTDKGRVREQNEDSYGYKGNLFLVADGMGGHQAGEIASAIAVETILDLDFGVADIGAELEKGILKANEAILEEVNHRPEMTGMGTTVAVLLIRDQTAFIAHVGDSRIYHYARGVLTQLTEDHSLVAELVKNGEITEDDAKTHPQRNILTQALGSRGDLNIEFLALEIQPGEKFLLCSDGLYGMVDRDGIEAILKLNEDTQELAEKLVEQANENGGSDNITVLIVEV